MLHNPRGEAPSRAGKRQVIVYLEGAEDIAVRACAKNSGDTLQAFLARAINGEFERRGMAPPLTLKKLHVFVRRNNPAKPRTASATATSRRGKYSIAGWFPIHEVERLTTVCAELGLTVQEIAQTGLSTLVRAEQTDSSAA